MDAELFHNLGPVTEKAQSPFSLRRKQGRVRRNLFDDLSLTPEL